MDVMEKAAQGDKQAMRLVEKEYGVGNPQDFAIEQLSVEEFPAKVTPFGRDYVTPSTIKYRNDARHQVKSFEKEMFGKKLAELEPSDQKDLLLKLSVIDPKGAAWANIRLNDPVGQEKLNMENWTFTNDWEYWEDINLSPEAQAVLDYYEEKFEPERPRGMKGWEWKPLPDAYYPSKFPPPSSYNIEPAFDSFTKETKMVDKKQPLEEVDESPKLTKVDIEYRKKREEEEERKKKEEERKKKEREELEKLFKSRGL